MNLSCIILAVFLAEPIIPHTIDGAEYICFDREWSKNLLQLRIDVPKLELKIKTLESLIENKDKQMIEYDKLISNDKEQIKVLNTELVLLNEQIIADKAWYKNRWFIFGLGIAGGIALSVGLIYGINSAL